MKRILINKPKTIICELCKKEFSSYSLSSHIKFAHKINVNDYSQQYGEFRKSKRINFSNRNIQKIQCKICNNKYSSIGMHTHLRDSHNSSIENYVKHYEEFRIKKLNYIEREKKTEYKISCLICNGLFLSERLLSYHLSKFHKISKLLYIKQYVFNNILPCCKCGCGKNTTLKLQTPYKVDFILGHNNNGKNNPMYGKFHNDNIKQSMSISAINRMKNNSNKFDTKPEIKFKKFLIDNNIEYVQQYITKYGAIDFYLQKYNMLVEIDGKYWHPENKENLNLQLLSGFISEKNKDLLYNLYRIREEDIEKIQSIEDIKNYSYKLNVNIDYYQKIINKDFLKFYIDTHGKDKLEKYIWLFLKFIKKFQPTFPSIPCNENIDNIISYIKKNTIYSTDRIFKNNIYIVGVNYLKSMFHSYWKSSYNGKLSPSRVWGDDKIIRNIIKYRIGINNSNEIFDFSLHQVIRGISAFRYSISFFKPLLASNIYKSFLGDKENPIVIDPCAGFGGRMLGFKSIYPNGTYIGIEPNIETYNELVILSKNFNNVKLYNCKLEDYTDTKECDLTFTSIPYYNLEMYSNNVFYESIENWKETFIKSLFTYNNLLINMPNDLYNYISIPCNNIFYIQSNTSHFDKNNTQKTELLCKYFK